MKRGRPERRDRHTACAHPRRIFYAAGPGDAIAAHQARAKGLHHKAEVSITFSSQIEDYAASVGASLNIVCHHARRELLRDGDVTIEHLPKPWRGARGAAFHLRELLYGLSLLWRSLRFRADAVILDSGCTHFFWQSLFRLGGGSVVSVLHNTLWPRGFRPRSPMARAVDWLDALFFRFVPHTTFCVSPECANQVEEITRGRHRPLHQIRAQFDASYFAGVKPHPPHRRPFQILFIGRVVADKGVFDIVEMAQRLEAAMPGAVRFVICGTGSDFDELKRRVEEARLGDAVRLEGWVTLERLRDLYAASHAAIVPTRSSFEEGLAMTAVEAVLAGRPVIASRVVPAVDLLGEAAIVAETNDVGSFTTEIARLVESAPFYEHCCAACPGAAEAFLDRSHGLARQLELRLGSCIAWRA